MRDPAYLGATDDWGAGRPLVVVDFRDEEFRGPWWKLSESLDSVRRSLGVGDVDIIAHSSGTRVALAYAASGAPVRRLCLVTPPAAWLTGEPDDVSASLRRRGDQGELREALATPPMTLTDEGQFLRHQRVTAPLGYAVWDAAAVAHSLTGATDFAGLRSFFSEPPPARLLTDIAALRIPVHVIGGEDDLLTGPENVRGLAALFSEGSVEMIEGSGHYPWIDQTERFRRSIARWALREKEREMATEEAANAQREEEIVIRPYAADDASATLRIFERAVSISALSRYTPAQVDAWLGGRRDLAAWAAERAAVATFVAERGGQIAGFSDLSEDGYVDRLFVDPEHGRHGVGAALLGHVEAQAVRRGIPTLTTHASLVARPVFEASGFTVAYPETVVKDGERLDRFFMTRSLTSTVARG